MVGAREAGRRDERNLKTAKRSRSHDGGKSTFTHTRPLLSVRETAERLNVSVATVRRYIRDGRLPAVRVGGVVRIDPAELEVYVYGLPSALPATSDERDVVASVPSEGDE